MRFDRLTFALTLGLAAAGASTLLAEQRAVEPAVSGEAQIASHYERGKDRTFFMVPVTIDLTKVRVLGRAAQLGGYVVKVRFDQERVTFVRTAGGAAPGFQSEPFVTTAARANEKGELRIAFAHAEPLAVGGLVDVARLYFRELTEGGAESVEVTIESVASTLVSDEEGRNISSVTIPVGKSGSEE